MGLTTAILAGATYNSFAKTLAVGLSPLSLLLLSEILTAFFILLSFGALPTIKLLSRLPRKAMAPLIAVGILNSCIGPLFYFTGLTYTSAVNASLFSASEMLFLLIFAVLLLREKWTNKQASAGALIVLGIIVIALRGLTEGFVLQRGDFLILFGSVIFASGGIVFRRFLSMLEPQVVILVRSFVAVGAFTVLSPFFEHPFVAETTSLSLALIPALLGFAFISRFLNLFGFYVSIERLPVATVSFFSSLIIIAGPVFAHFYLGEDLLWYHFVGGALIVAGTVLLESFGLHATKEHHRRHLKHRVHYGL
jgi:drug/metabolite transporter (DMT)-like permease